MRGFRYNKKGQHSVVSFESGTTLKAIHFMKLFASKYCYLHKYCPCYCSSVFYNLYFHLFGIIQDCLGLDLVSFEIVCKNQNDGKMFRSFNFPDLFFRKEIPGLFLHFIYKSF